MAAYRPPAVPTTEALARVLSARYITKRSTQPAQPKWPSPGGQASGIADASVKPGSVRGGGVWHPTDLTTGYQTSPSVQDRR